MGWAGEAFEKGKAAMVFEGGWLPADLNNNFKSVNYGVVQMPKGTAAKSNLIFNGVVLDLREDKEPESGVGASANYLTGADNQTKGSEGRLSRCRRARAREPDHERELQGDLRWRAYGQAVQLRQREHGQGERREFIKALESVMLRSRT